MEQSGRNQRQLVANAPSAGYRSRARCISTSSERRTDRANSRVQFGPASLMTPARAQRPRVRHRLRKRPGMTPDAGASERNVPAAPNWLVEQNVLEWEQREQLLSVLGDQQLLL